MGGGSPDRWPCAVCGTQETKTFSSGYPAGRIGDRGDREIVSVPNVYVPFPAPIAVEPKVRLPGHGYNPFCSHSSCCLAVLVYQYFEEAFCAHKVRLKWYGFKGFPSHSSHCSGGLFPQHSGVSPLFLPKRRFRTVCISHDLSGPLDRLNAILSLLQHLNRYRAPSAIGSAIGRTLSRPV